MFVFLLTLPFPSLTISHGEVRKMNHQLSCSFTGHRPEKLPWGSNESDARCLQFKAELWSALQAAFAQGYRHFICGMARGADLQFCEAALLLRELHPDVRVEAAIPFAGQADRWIPQERLRYHALLARCDFETVIQHTYTAGCLQRRNRYLVDHSSRLIAAYSGQGGGTLYTIHYAIRKQCDVIILDV